MIERMTPPSESDEERKSHRTAKHKLNPRTFILGGVIVVALIILIAFLNKPSLADKQCSDRLGAGGVWVAQMNQCGCADGYIESGGAACVPN